jgi:hypothetical protein
MGLRSLIAVVAVGLTFGMVACSKDAQKVQPETRGKRGESCLARNDCDTGLACINGTCSKNEFAVDVAAKHCDRIECNDDKGCCGDKATMAPAKCKDRTLVCETPTAADCTQSICTDATEDTVCGEGSCRLGTCSNTGVQCASVTDCADTCVIPVDSTIGQCAQSLLSCTSDANCAGSCSTRTCNCANPAYDPADPICADEDCIDICLLRCRDQLCVQDDSCEVDADCFAAGLQICDGGRCVECTSNTDCDEDAEETCESGQCHRPCKYNEECGIFEECSSTGDCEYVGCRSDRECILAAARGLGDGTGGTNNQSVSPGDDPRMFECLPSDTQEGIKVCKIPCENDGSCGQFQVCDDGYCKFIGCENDEECRAYLGIANQVTSEAKPYVATAVCVE